MKRRIEVKYQVEFAVTIEVEEGDSIPDAISGIDVPESPLNGVDCSKYVSGTYEVLSAVDAVSGENVNYDDEDVVKDDEGLSHLLKNSS